MSVVVIVTAFPLPEYRVEVIAAFEEAITGRSRRDFADSRQSPGPAGKAWDLARQAPGRICVGRGLFQLLVAGPGFEPGKAKPTVLQTAPFGRSGNLPGADPQDGTVKDSGPWGCLRHVHATAT